MLNVTKIIRYKFNGQEWDSLQKVKTCAENMLGAHIDKMTTDTLPPKARLQIHDYLIKNREELIDLLSIEVNTEENYTYEDVNIFDIDKE